MHGRSSKEIADQLVVSSLSLSTSVNFRNAIIYNEVDLFGNPLDMI